MKTYETPVLEVSYFDTVDVILTSDIGGDNDNGNADGEI